MHVLSRRSGWRLCVPVVLGAVLAAAGCGDPSGIPKTVQVKGKVMLGGEPLTSGMVSYIPAEGSTSKFRAGGGIGSDGTYTLTTGSATGQKPGAVPGKYKVIINTNTPPMGTDAPPKPVAIDPVYNDEARTPLSVEVSESAPPGTYDLPLKK